MACSSVTMPASPTTTQFGSDLRRPDSSKDLTNQANMRRCYSDGHLCKSMNCLGVSAVQPKLKTSRSFGFPFQIAGSFIPRSVRTLLFDPETSRMTSMEYKELGNEVGSSNKGSKFGEHEEVKRTNWMERLLEIRSHWRNRHPKDDMDEESYMDEAGDCYGDGDEDGCLADYDSEEEEEFDCEMFNRLLKRVPWSDTKLFSRLAFLCNMAYVISDIKANDLKRHYGLHFVTSSLEKKAELAAIKAKLEEDSNCVPAIAGLTGEQAEDLEQKRPICPEVAYGIAASAASYVQSRAKETHQDSSGSKQDFSSEQLEKEAESSPRVYKSEVAATIAASTMTSVVAAGEEEKQETAKDLQSLQSSPCEWFVCDDLGTYTRCFVIQGSDSFASWQANLFFEPAKFEGTDVLVHRGIYEAAKGIYDQYMPEIISHLETYGDRAKLQFTGHSLGGSLSLLIHLMLLTRKVVKPSTLRPVVTFGSPFIFCGGHKVLNTLGLDENHIHNVMMHRDIVPRAFSCNYPDHVAVLLKRLNGTFRSHPCLNKQKMLYSPLGKIFILQPEEESPTSTSSLLTSYTTSHASTFSSIPKYREKNRTPHRISENPSSSSSSSSSFGSLLFSIPSFFITKSRYTIKSQPFILQLLVSSLIPFGALLCSSMASAALASSTNQLFDDGGGELNRHEIQSAIAKAVELRALHAALIQGTNSSSPSSSRPPLPHFSAVDYPVFTPSYEDEPFQGTLYPLPARSRAASESWDECDNNYSYSCRNVAADDQKSVTGSCAGGNNNIAVVLRASPELCKSGRALNHLAADFKSSSSSCNRFRQTGGESSIAAAAVNHKKNRVNSNIVVPLTDSHASVQSQPRSKGVMSWLFPRLRKNKNKQPNHEANFFSSNRTESDNASQAFGGESGVLFSIETLRRELRESNETRDAALAEVSETRSSLDSLRQKLEHLEGYCEELKKSLKSAARATRRSKSIDGNADGNVNSSNSIFPVSDEAMVEGFLQMASESRLSVKQFCKTLILQIDEYDTDLTIGNSNRDSNSKSFLHQLESAINEAMYLDFENSEFRRNGSPKHLDKSQDRQAKFQSFVSLRNLSWNEVLRKGTKYYSEEFSKFCDQKMSCVIAALNWTRPWPEQLLQAFFVAAKCIWLLHLLAFSFVPAIGVMRVEEGREFDHGYMEDMERQRDAGGGRRKVVKAMVMPGFYVNGGRVLRCKVLCRYYNNGHNGYASATS